MSEEQQRWGGARDTGTIDMDAFRRDVQQEDAAEQKKKASNVCAHTFEKDSPKDRKIFGERVDKSSLIWAIIGERIRHDRLEGLRRLLRRGDRQDGQVCRWS